MSFHFQSRYWWASGNGTCGKSSDTYSAGAGWRICDLIIHLSNLSLQCTLSTNYVQISRTGRVWYIYAGAWQEGGMRMLTVLTKHSLCSWAMCSISHASPLETINQDTLNLLSNLSSLIKATTILTQRLAMVPQIFSILSIAFSLPSAFTECQLWSRYVVTEVSTWSL